MNGSLTTKSIAALVVLALVLFFIGFLWLPSVQQDIAGEGVWTALCRAAGVPARSSKLVTGAQDRGTHVVLTRSMARPGTVEAIGRGATLALSCTMCHGALGISASNAPNLAGQYPEVIIKQLEDFRAGDRESPIMQAMASTLDDGKIRDLAAYFGSLPKPRTALTPSEELPSLMRAGNPMRNIAPCISCHGGVDQKLGAPWLEGMPRQYLVAQLEAFASGARRNDAQAQMRNMARRLTGAEIGAVASAYAGQADRGR